MAGQAIKGTLLFQDDFKGLKHYTSVALAQVNDDAEVLPIGMNAFINCAEAVLYLAFSLFLLV